MANPPAKRVINSNLSYLACPHITQLKSLNKEDTHRIFFGLPDLVTLRIENTHWMADPALLAHFLRSLEALDQIAVSNIRSLTLQAESLSHHLGTPQFVPFVDTNLFCNVLSRFPKLRALDLASTPIDPKALFAIHSDAMLQYLDFSTCQDNDTSTLAHFLTSHLAVQTSLVVLDCTRVEFGEWDTTRILETLPPILRSLNLSSSVMNRSHVPHLQSLVNCLEELSVGFGLTMENVEISILGLLRGRVR